MLKGPLLHPPLLQALARAGHGSKVLVADGNFPHATRLGPNARLVHLNLAPGLVSATDVLAVLRDVVPVEAVEVMQPLREGPYAMAGAPPIFDEARALLPGLDLTPLDRLAFYDAAAGPDVAVTVATGEERLYGNFLLTIGAVVPRG